MSEISIANVINISVSDSPSGLNAFNTSNLGLFTHETPGGGFGSGDYKIYKSPSGVGEDFGTDSVTYKMSVATFAQSKSILTGGGYLAVMPLEVSEALAVAIERMKSQVQFYGVMGSQIYGSTETLDAAAVIQTLNKIAGFVQRDPEEMEEGGILEIIKAQSLTKSRGLYYGADSTGVGSDLKSLLFQAAFMSRGLSTNFAGSRTTQTQHLKSLATIEPDSTMDETLLQLAEDAGVDTYPSIEGVPAIFDQGANQFWDQVYNLGWFVASLQVNGFNFLRQTSTKVPQTEEGVQGLKSAYRQSCLQARDNLYCAPGEWTSPDTFGNQEDFYANIREQGYYIYSAPIATQSAADRASRKAPLVQIALKEAGALHSSDVIININP